MIRLTTPLTKEKLCGLNVGDQVLLTGTLYTARDQAHKRLVELIKKRKRLPIPLKDKIIYYCGPTATPKGKAIGSCGPTTSSRMDPFIKPLLAKGLSGMVGKGKRNAQARSLIKKYQAIYFVAPAGCAALLAKKVMSKKLLCFGDLGPEAIYELQIKDFPLIVGIDSRGKDIYKHL